MDSNSDRGGVIGVNRRDLGRMLAGMAAAHVASAGGPDASWSQLEDGSLEWTIGNPVFRQRFRLTRGKFHCSSLLNVRASQEWIHPAETSDEFLVEFIGSSGKRQMLTGRDRWEYMTHSTGREQPSWNRLSVVLGNVEHALMVTRHYLCHERLPVVRQWTTVGNSGQHRVTVTRLDTFRLRLAPVPQALELRWMSNFGRAMKPSPGNPIHSRSVDENVEHLIRTGPYSPDCAWFSLGIPQQEHGVAGGWEWSGPMAVGFGGSLDPCLIYGGLDPEGMAEPLDPGGAMNAPAGWYGFFDGDQDEAASLSHQLIRTSLGPALPERDFPWVGYCTWAPALDERNPFNEPHTRPWFPTQKNVLSQVQAAADLGCELFLWDYGWFPRVGDWWFDQTRFPDGPKPVADAVHRRGMKFGLWVGFGNAEDKSQVVKEHPDWLAEYRGKPIPDDFFIRTGASTWNTRILCLAHKPAREWAKQQLARLIESCELDWLKHDFDIITICQSSGHTHTPGDGRIAACEGFYEIMDFVRAKYPRLVCEHWTNDSATPDYGVAARHHVQLIGDAYQSFLLRQMVYGHTQIFPLDRQHRYLRLEDSQGDLTYVLQSSMIGGPWTLLSDPRTMTSDNRRILAREIELYKRFRPLCADGRVYRLITRPHSRVWDALELWSEARGEGVVYVFRNDHPASVRPVPLRGLRRQDTYRLEFIRAGSSAEASGRSLMEEGIAVSLPKRNSAEVIAISRKT